MAFLLVIDSWTVGAALGLLCLILFFALLLNPPTEWVKRMMGRK